MVHFIRYISYFHSEITQKKLNKEKFVYIQLWSLINNQYCDVIDIMIMFKK